MGKGQVQYDQMVNNDLIRITQLAEARRMIIADETVPTDLKDACIRSLNHEIAQRVTVMGKMIKAQRHLYPRQHFDQSKFAFG